MTIANLLTFISSVVTEAITWIGQFVTVVTNNPLILLFVVIAFVGLGVGLLSRLLHL